MTRLASSGRLSFRQVVVLVRFRELLIARFLGVVELEIALYMIG